MFIIIAKKTNLDSYLGVPKNKKNVITRSGATWTTDRRELINAFETNTTLIIPGLSSSSANWGLLRCAHNDEMVMFIIIAKKTNLAT